ncbi:MAG TPA: hypothetical protein VF472_09820 [Burkholderiaceae bacterium]
MLFRDTAPGAFYANKTCRAGRILPQGMDGTLTKIVKHDNEIRRWAAGALHLARTSVVRAMMQAGTAL